jgi:hypothetical protein
MPCLSFGRLDPYAFAVKEFKLLKSGSRDPLVFEDLSTDIIAVSATVALLGAVHVLQDFRFLIDGLDAEAAWFEPIVCPQLGGDPRQHCFA